MSKACSNRLQQRIAIEKWEFRLWETKLWNDCRKKLQISSKFTALDSKIGNGHILQIIKKKIAKWEETKNLIKFSDGKNYYIIDIVLLKIKLFTKKMQWEFI